MARRGSVPAGPVPDRSGTQPNNHAGLIPFTKARTEVSPIAVPALVDEALFEAVAEQLAENRRRARQRQRGARNLLQGLVVCKRCGYAFYT